jgi:hypothetical protein
MIHTSFFPDVIFLMHHEDDDQLQLNDRCLQTEDEIQTLRQVLAARQKHATDLKRKLGITPLTEITADISQSIHSVKDTQAWVLRCSSRASRDGHDERRCCDNCRFQKTSEMVSTTADTMKNKWTDMRNSSFFKSFETKLGSAYNNVSQGESASLWVVEMTQTDMHNTWILQLTRGTFAEGEMGNEK